MSQITQAEKALLETKPHATKLWLSIYQPNTMLAGTVNDATITRGARTITYTLISGSYTLVASGMIMLVGTTPGGDDKGKIRVRSATAASILVAENADIDWEDGDYITILNFFEITSVYPRIIQDPADEENTLWYKDYDIEYTDQNSVLGSFICMGPHHAAFLEEGGEVDIYYTASGTYNLKGGAMSYDWWFQGATATGSSDAVPGWITYDTPGHYTTRLEVTTGEGASDFSYRHVSIYNRPGVGQNVPILKWNVEELAGDREQGGWTATIVIREPVSKTTVRDGALVVVFQESWYGSTKQEIGGNASNRSEILFTGYILDGTIQYNYEDQSVEFEVGSATYVMQSLDCPAISVTSSANPAAQAAGDENYPSAWALVLDLNVKRAIYHYYRWHSTVLLCNDFEYVGDDFEMRHFESDRASLYDAISTLMKEALVGTLIADRQGKLWAEIDVSAIDDVNSVIDISDLPINKDKWIGEPSIDERTVPEVSYLEMGGVVYNGPEAETYSALLSEAPGNVPGRRGKYIKGNARLALLNQSQLNTLCGNVFAAMNNRYPASEYRLAGHYFNFDIAPQELVELTLEETDTPRRISFSGDKFVIKQMTIINDSASQSTLPVVTLAKTTQGIDGATVTIPDIPPTDPGDGGGGVDPLDVPPLPPPIWPGGSVGLACMAARFKVTSLAAADVSETLLIRGDQYWINTADISVGGAVGDGYAYAKAESSGIYLVNMYIYAKCESAFTLHVDYWPCPGAVMGAGWYSASFDVDEQMHTELLSLATYKGYYFVAIPITFVTFPQVGGISDTTQLAHVWIRSDVEGVRVSGSLGIIKLLSETVSSICVAAQPPGG